MGGQIRNGEQVHEREDTGKRQRTYVKLYRKSYRRLPIAVHCRMQGARDEGEVVRVAGLVDVNIQIRRS